MVCKATIPISFAVRLRTADWARLRIARKDLNPRHTGRICRGSSLTRMIELKAVANRIRQVIGFLFSRFSCPLHPSHPCGTLEFCLGFAWSLPPHAPRFARTRRGLDGCSLRLHLGVGRRLRRCSGRVSHCFHRSLALRNPVARAECFFRRARHGSHGRWATDRPQ